MSIDIHAHVVPEPFVRDLQSEVPAVAPTIEKVGDDWWFSYPFGRKTGPMPAGAFDLGERLAAMDRQDVDIQALSVPPGHFLYWIDDAQQAVTAARMHNDAMVDMARAHPDRFLVLGTLPLQAPEAAVEEIARLEKIAEVAGVEMCTNVDGKPLDDESLADVWAAINAAGMPVVLHPDNFGGVERFQRHYLMNFVGNPTDSTQAAGALMFGGVLTENPALRIALLHGGGFLPYQIGRFEHGWKVRPEPKVKLQTSPREMLDRFYFDSLTHDDASLRFLLERVGPARVCCGSDYPFDMADMDPVRSVRRAIPDEEIANQIVETTPREFLTRRPPTS